MRGELTVAGLGPGEKKQRTLAVQQALEDAECIVGYTTYIHPLREEFTGKEFCVSGMTREIERCRQALAAADEGKRVVLVSSGDAGIFGMASPLLELAEEFPEVRIRILPGVTAASSGSALLGAPLGHDFAVISLSDRMTPWEEIERRLALVAQADMPVVIYNPSSHARKDYLRRACRILLLYLPGSTPCGLTWNIGRKGERAEILSLEELAESDVDMFTTVFIGDRTTRIRGGRMVTPRGYRIGEAQ